MEPRTDLELSPIEAIMTTRAIRRFTDDPVTDEEIEICLRAAQQAPSGGNVQPQQYIVLTHPAVKAEIGRWYTAAYDRYEETHPDESEFSDPDKLAAFKRTAAVSRHLADHIGEAPAIVVVLQPIIPWGGRDAEGPLDIGRLDASVYPAVQNFCVAARSLGIGTALTTVIRIYTEQVLTALGVPNRSDGSRRYEIAALIPMGRPAGNFGVAPRKPASAATHWNRFGEKR